MFTIGAFLATILLAWYVDRKNEQDRAIYDSAASDVRVWLLVLAIRQDLKLIAFFLAAVIVMLGVIADSVH